MKKFTLLLIFLILLTIVPINIKANETVNIYLFYSETCPHCHKADKVINELLENNSAVNYYKYECTKDVNAYNRSILNQTANILGIEKVAFPLVVIGNNYIIGYGDGIKKNYQEMIDFYKTNDYKDQVGVLLGLTDENNNPVVKKDQEYTIKLPIFGKINLKNLSLPIIAMAIGFTDGFNPCAMWVLLFLITMLLNVKNRRKMWLLGLTFILTSGFIYFLFMMAWLNITDYMNQISLLRNLIALFALGFGGYNLYNYFKTRKSDGCTVIKKEKRNFFINKIKHVITNKSFFLAIIGIMLIACLVNLVELLCSMG